MGDGNAPGGGGLDAKGGGRDPGGGPVGLAGTIFGGNVVWAGLLGGIGPLANTPGGGGPGLLPVKGGGCWPSSEVLGGLVAVPPTLLDCC